MIVEIDTFEPKILVGIDGTEAGDRALAQAMRMAHASPERRIHLLYVIEWQPYPFQTTEENTARMERRETEVTLANKRLIMPNVRTLEQQGYQATGEVRHGDVAELLTLVAQEQSASDIVVARATERGIKTKLFGTVTARLMMSTKIPITVVP